ncbi:MAG: glycerate kinase [Cyclobacteriaceae bacterium]|nr:glycerate kinase [Cyclobacteriaceae bacterium]
MKVLIAPDKFKGSLSAQEVSAAIGTALLKLDPTIQLQPIAMADGGEGTAQLLTTHTNGSWINCSVHDPLFRKAEAGFGISGDGKTAFIEMASASGLQLLTPWEHDPLKTTTVGTGELIAQALQHEVKKIVLAIGGSATNDAGIGMAQALGYKFFDQQDNELIPIGENLEYLHRVDTTAVHPRLRSTEFIVLCDVTNPLYGKQGAAYVFGPQKGANQQDVLQLDKGLQHFANIAHAQLNASTEFAGAGAAGGLGAGAKVFLHATMQRGIDYVMEALQVETAMAHADLVITGEGKMDLQTLSGKVVAGITSIATRLNKPVIAVVGKNELTETKWRQAGIIQVISLVDETTTVEVALSKTHELIQKRIEAQINLKHFSG